MALREKILDFFKKFGAKSGSKKKFKEGRDSAMFPPDPMGKRPKGFRMPEWAKLDYFQKKDMGTMVPPEELAEEMSLKNPASWLVKKIKGTNKIQQFENTKETRYARRGTQSMSDQEIDNFLGEVMKKSAKKRKRPGKKSRFKSRFP